MSVGIRLKKEVMDAIENALLVLPVVPTVRVEVVSVRRLWLRRTSLLLLLLSFRREFMTANDAE